MATMNAWAEHVWNVAAARGRRRAVSFPTRGPRQLLSFVGAVAFAGLLTGGCAGISFGGHAISKAQGTKITIGQLFRQGQQYQKAGHLKLARDRYVQIIKLDPLNQYAYYDVGVVYQSDGQNSAAASAYEKALAINPGYVPALFNLAGIDAATSGPTAVALYEILEQLNPKNPAPYFNLGLLYIHMGQKAVGESQLAKAVQLDPALSSRIPANVVLPTANQAAPAST